jgi:hypothetical protein
MKHLILLTNVVIEYFHDKVEWFRHRKQKPTLLALAVDVFTNESWLDGINRQGRLMEHLYYYNEQTQ